MDSANNNGSGAGKVDSLLVSDVYFKVVVYLFLCKIMNHRRNAM
jgi:hypothetical protein